MQRHGDASEYGVGQILYLFVVIVMFYTSPQAAFSMLGVCTRAESCQGLELWK